MVAGAEVKVETKAQVRVVALDPGHGGVDPGAVRDGVLEKDVNLDVARTVGELLVKRGYRVVATREADVAVALAERVQIAARAGADILVSVHCNAVEDEGPQGVETWHQEGDVGGKALAGAVQARVVAITNAKDRKVKATAGGIYVLRWVGRPAALVEMGFLSNATERRLLSSAPYRQSLAGAIVEGIEEYYRKMKGW